MNKKAAAFIAVAVLLAAQLACSSPNRIGGSEATQLPAPNQTLTALFAIIQSSTSTPTLPLVITATSPAGGGANPTATRSPGPGATAAPSATTAPTATHTAAANPTATVIKSPQPTATIPSARTRSLVQAKYLSTPPTIDGDWSEWKDTTKEYPGNFVVWGSGNWTGEEDLASSFHIGWDNNNLYIAVKVHDDTYVQNASGANIYKGDSLELLLDTHLQDDFYTTGLSPDDFQLGISPGRPDPDGTKEAYLWFPSSIAGQRDSVTIAARLEDGIYRVEAAIPWSVFQITPASGQHYGFAISVNDNDDTANAVQQSMVSNVAARHLTDPTTWGDLQLVK